MKRSLSLKRPMFALAATSFIFAAFVTADGAHAQTSENTTVVSSAKVGLKVGALAYVTSDALNLRSKASTTADAVVGQLEINDQVQILDLLDSSTALVKIRIVKSNYASNSLATDLYVSSAYLSPTPSNNSVSSNGLSKYIVIQNVATEKMRVYERCTSSPGCANKMVFETDMVVGRPEGAKGDKFAFVTWLGRYKITDWVKFYQDGAENYPSWYDPEMPPTPKAGSGGGAWLSKKALPNKQGEMRGAFGWYAAMTGPNSNNQWIHGTIGWGSDGDKFIKMTRSFWLNLVADPRSHGCTRLENRAIAYSRHILPIGTEVLRVYAIEALRDVSRAAYQAQTQATPWEFILTKEGVRKSGAATSDKNSVLARGVSEDLILERGSYNVDKYPTGAPITSARASSGKSGNTYNIDNKNFRGVLLIDEGTFVNYEHPAGLPVGGYVDRAIPQSLQTSGNYQVVTKEIK